MGSRTPSEYSSQLAFNAPDLQNSEQVVVKQIKSSEKQTSALRITSSRTASGDVTPGGAVTPVVGATSRPPSVSAFRRASSAVAAGARAYVAESFDLPPEHDERKKSVKWDEEMQNANRNRSCTDVICLLLFAANIAVMMWIAVIALTKGAPRRIIYGTDSYGNTCNQDNTKIVDANFSGRDFRGYKTFYFDFYKYVDGSSGNDTLAICVKKCPNENIVTFSNLEVWSVAQNTSLCRYDVDITQVTNDTQLCPSVPIPIHGSALSRCVPFLDNSVGTSIFSEANATGQLISSYIPGNCALLKQPSTAVFADIEKIGVDIILVTLITLVLSFIIVFIMTIKIVITFIVWGLLVGSLLIGLITTIYLWLEWQIYSDHLKQIPKDQQRASEVSYVQRWFYGAIAMTVLEVVMLLLLIFLVKKIQVAVLLFHQAGQVLKDMPCLVFQPFVTLGFYIMLVAGQAYIFAYIYSAADPVVDTYTCTVKFVPVQAFVIAKFYYIFGILWCWQFIHACETLYVSGCVSDWYFTRDKSGFLQCLRSPKGMLLSYYRLIRYHLGSAAFGAILIAIVEFIRFMMFYLKKTFHGRENSCLKFIYRAVQCCLWCFQKFLEFLSKNAFIVVAAVGSNFCISGKRALALMVKNAEALAVINLISAILLFLAKIGVVVLTVLIAFTQFKNRLDLCNIVVPLTAVGLLSYCVAHCFFTLFSLIISTVFLSFAIDVEENNGEDRPYFMSKDLMMLMDKVNKRVPLNSYRAQTEIEEKKQRGGESGDK